MVDRQGYFRTTFRSLGHRGYRLFYIGLTVSTIGTWAHKVAQAWLVLELTGSGTLLGLTVALQQLPTLLLTAWAGGLADRFSRVRILMVMQLAGVVTPLVLGVLSAAELVTVPVVMALAAATGIVDAVDKPVRHTLAADLVPTEHVTNAVSLNVTMFNAGKVVGPAVAGLAISQVGVSATFFGNAVTFLVAAFLLQRIRPGDVHSRPAVMTDDGSMRSGLSYARRTPAIAAVLGLMTMTGLVAYEWNTAIPLLAQHFSPDATTIGLFFTAMGVGAIAGSLALAGVLRATPAAVLVALAVFVVVLAATSMAPNVPVALGCLALLGASSTTLRALATSVVQVTSEPALRGRMVSLLILALNGTSVVSAPLIGAVAEARGVRVALLGGAALSALAGLVAWRGLVRASARATARLSCPDAPDRGSPS